MLQYKVVTTLEELEPYKETWSSILERNQNDNPFIEYEWISTWWRLLGNSEPAEIYIVLNGDQVIAFSPLVHTIRFGIHHFRFLGGDEVIYMDIISDNLWREESINYLLGELEQKFQHVLFILNHLLESKETSQFLEKYAVERQKPYSIHRVVVPQVDFTSIDFQEYTKSLRKKFAEMNRRMKILKSHGNVTFQELGVESFDQVFRVYDKRWKKRIENSGFTEDLTQTFLKSLAAQKSDAFHLEVNGLKFEDKVVAFTFNLCCRGRKTMMRIGYEPDFHLIAPGSLIVREEIYNAQSINFQVFDFGSGFEPYKLMWASNLDFVRKFVMCTNGKKERAYRFFLSLLLAFKYKLSSSHRYVELKRNKFGEILYLLKEASNKERVEKIKEIFGRVFEFRATDLYYIENEVQNNPSKFREVAMNEVLGRDNSSEFIPFYLKRYKLFSRNGQKIDFKRLDGQFKEETLGIRRDLPSKTTYIKDFEMENLPDILNEVQREGLSLLTNVPWYSRAQRKQLKKLGFQHIERISKFGVLGLKKVVQKKYSKGS